MLAEFEKEADCEGEVFGRRKVMACLEMEAEIEDSRRNNEVLRILLTINNVTC